MKAIFIIFDEAIDSRVMSGLAELGVDHYTKFSKLLGAGTHSDPHLNDLIWPGANYGLLIVTDDLTKTKIVAQMKTLKAEHLKEGVKVFVLPVEEVI